MTAEKQGEGAAAFWRLIGVLRQRWLLIATLLTALFWLQDRVQIHLGLPDRVAAQETAVVALARRLDRVETRLGWAERWLMRCARASGTALPRELPTALSGEGGTGGWRSAGGCDLDP